MGRIEWATVAGMVVTGDLQMDRRRCCVRSGSTLTPTSAQWQHMAVLEAMSLLHSGRVLVSRAEAREQLPVRQ